VNAPEDRFCGGCGQRLDTITLPSPLQAQFASLQSYTPRHLADRILTSRFALEGEHKQVTVLFCDLANSTMLAERLGARAMHTLLTRFFELALSQVHHYEGTINQFLGDGFMALFGAPLAHEDHARRAALAALGIQQHVGPIRTDLARQYGVEFAVRMGLNTGSVVVGSIGDNLRMDYTAIGDTTNLAARMQQLALPGTIYVTEATYRGVKEGFQWQSRGQQTVKGKTAPMPVYELLGQRHVKNQFDMAAQRGLTRFVGRNSELHQLLTVWEKAKGSQGQVVSIVGEAGIGKSRLTYELKARLAQEDARYIEGACFTYGEGISYLPFLEIVKGLLKLEGNITEEEAKRRMRQRLHELNVEPSSVVPYLHNLLTLTVEDEVFPTLTGELIRQRTVEVLTRLVIAEAHHRPLVLILEDVHWIDKASEDVLATLIEGLVQAPLLLVLVYRQEYWHQWMDKAYHAQISLVRLPSASSAEMVRAVLSKPYALQVSLERLTPEQSQAMVQELLGVTTIPIELEQLVATKTDGNPLFVEELVRSLLENRDLVRKNGSYVLNRPVEVLDIPTTVQGVLLTRIDRLHEALKYVLQVMSVIGRVFRYPVLAQVVERGLELDEILGRLEDLEFIYPTSITPQQEYSFKHVLTQEVVYQTLLNQKCEEYHERVGAAFEALYPDRLEEYYEVLAYHYGHSGNRDKAVEYLDRAGRKAGRANAMEEAKHYFDEAMQGFDVLPDIEGNQRRRLSLLVNSALVFLSLLKLQEYYDLLTRYKPLAMTLGDPGLLGAFYGCMGWSEHQFGYLSQSIQTLSQAAALCEAARNVEDVEQAYALWQWSYFWQGDYEQVLALEDQLLPKMEQKYWSMWVLLAASRAYTFLGRWDEAVEVGHKGLRVGEESADDRIISTAAWSLACAYNARGDLVRAIEWAELAVQKAPTLVDKIWSQGFLGWVWCRTAEVRRGIEILTQVIPIFRAAHVPLGNFFTLCLGEGYWQAGDYDQARQTFDELLESAERCGMRFEMGAAHRFLGEIALKTNPSQGEEPLAAPHFKKSKAVLQEIKAENELAFAYAGYGRLHKQQGNMEQAREYLTKALKIFERLGTLREPERVRQVLAELP
jgi:class 3 adenylate cyclase/tetratricopeptide (TPR) repeat protein